MSGHPLINVEAETALLGAMMFDNAIIDRIADTVSSDDFHDPLHGRIYAALLRETSLGNAAHPISIKGYFEGDEGMQAVGGVGYLARLSAVDTGILAPYDLAKQIANLSRRRIMQAGLATAAEACADLESTDAEIIGHADSALESRSNDVIHQPTGGDCFDEMLAGFKENIPGVTCRQIGELDRLLGPLKPKQLIIGAGRPGMGKTALALSYAIGAARNGHGVLFVSLEMSSTELATRMASDLCFDTDCKVPFNAIRDGKLSSDQYRMVSEARDFMHELPFQVIDAGNLRVGRLSALIRRHGRRMAAKGQKLELVVVDYLQLLSPDNKGRSNYEAVSEVSRSLKAMAKDHGITILALAQLSREVEKRPDKRPQLADLRDSGQIEQDADAVLFLLRPEYYLRQEEPDQMSPKRAEWEHALQEVGGKIEFILAKRRNGTTGTATGLFHGAYQAVRG